MQAVQCSHAAIQAANRFSLPDHVYLVLLAVKSEAELTEVQAFLKEYCVEHAAFVEDDLGNQMTAIATEPISGAKRQIFRRFQCLKERKAA
jgi:hypothetical protein